MKRTTKNYGPKDGSTCRSQRAEHMGRHRWKGMASGFYGLAMEVSCLDKRLQQMVVAAAVYDGARGMREMGKLTALLAPPRTQLRGWLLGLTMILQHVEGYVKVGTTNKRAVHLWQQGPPFQEHVDILGGVTQEWWEQIEVVYIPKTEKKEVWTQQLAQANGKTKPVAKKRAIEEREPSLEQITKETDSWHEEIYEYAIERISLLLSSKEHFVRDIPKKGKRQTFEKRVVAKRSFLAEQTKNPGVNRGHLWMEQQGKFKCLQCKMGMHVGMPWRKPKRVGTEKCPMREEQPGTAGSVTWAADAERPRLGDGYLSKADFYKGLVEQPQQYENSHEWHMKATGISCTKCGVWMGRSFSWQQVKEVVNVQCKGSMERPPKGVKLHTTHEMTKIEGGWKCKVCKHTMHSREGRWQLQTAG